MSLTRVFFAGDLRPGSTCVPRLSGLRALGLTVTSMDTSAQLASPIRLVNSINVRMPLTLRMRRLNRELLEEASRARPDVVWIEKGTWIYPGTLRHLRRFARFIVHYNTDDMMSGSFWYGRRSATLYDVQLTTNRWNVSEINHLCGVRTLRVGMGYDQDVHRPPPSKQLTNDVVFIGHWEPHTEEYVTALRDGGVATRVWGHNWRKARMAGLRAIRPLPHADYVPTLASSKLALCSLSRWNRNESTGRSFEIPAIGTGLLAEYTGEHQYLYGDGVGAALFRNPQELVEKARYYLSHAAEREALAANGYQRTQDLNLSWAGHLRQEWPLVERWLTSAGQNLFERDDDPFWPGFRRGDAVPGHP